MNTIKATPHLIATDEDNPTRVNIMLLPQKNKLYTHVAGGEFRRGLQMGHKPQHLYITTDEEIKEGEYGLISGMVGGKLGIYPKKFEKGDKQEAYLGKIVATTNPELNKGKMSSFSRNFVAGIASIPQSFIQSYIKRYNEDNSIKEVLLKILEEEFNDPTNKYSELNLTSDGCIVIHPVEERTYTRAEAREMANKAIKVFSYVDAIIQKQFDKWFDKNYPQ